MIRSQFKISYLVAELLPLAAKLANHHRSREKHYREEYFNAEKNLKENGLIMAENAAGIVSGAITGFGYGGKSFSPKVDEKMVEAVNNAKNKVHEHKTAAEQYEKQMRIFSIALRESEVVKIELDADDVDFFEVKI